ncbi:MAG: proline--tRNA ligase [Myxococcota bacterium]|jgi:prolyl-tRNA synthetase|nr:proline--tRNA ligase [Myxococcota bacterium]
MRFSQAFIPTRKNDPADAEMPSHQLLLRAGFIEQLAAGIYNLLPLAWRSVFKISQIIRQELERAGAQEILMPAVQPAEIWQKSGRWEYYGAELLRFKDRKQQDYCLGPTHEEVVTDLVSRHVRSYRDMPLNLFQIQAKFRDELRPRAGLLRGREFVMKDAYSFDASFEAAKLSYDKMFEAYSRIFSRCGLVFRAVEADTGNIGGSHSHEFQVLAKTGEDRIVSCACCGYTANEEKAETRRNPALQALLDDPAALQPSTQTPAIAIVDTPSQRSIAEVTAFLDVSAQQLIKTLLYLVDGKDVVAVLLRGDRELNEIKLKGMLGCHELVLAAESAVREASGAAVGFAGPVGLQIPVYADLEVGEMHDAVTGANQDHKHLLHVEPGRDFKVQRFADLVMASEGDPCPRCDGQLNEFRGIEVGHVFLLGTKYSAPMGATFLDTQGDAKPVVMGCYGIGVTRILAAAIEQNHDADGIIFPMAIAPYQVLIVPLQTNDAEVVAAGEQLYAQFREAGIDVLLDDRDARAGAKFKDADLIGIPLRITIGARGLKEGQVELKARAEKEISLIPIDDALSQVRARIVAALHTGSL